MDLSCGPIHRDGHERQKVNKAIELEHTFGVRNYEPPLIVDRETIDWAVETIGAALKQMAAVN